MSRAKAEPGKLNCATAGVGTTPHLALELLKLRAGLDIVHVGFAGGGPATSAALSGTTELFFSALPNVLEHIRAGTLIPIGVASAQRWPTLPEVPTFIDAGLKDFVTDTIHILLAPAGTPPEVVQKLAATSLEILARSDIKERVQTLGYRIVAGGPDVLKARIAREVPFYREIVTAAKLPVIQ
jgi:tripartite-type tricarboxylate transporter receptor subunit TctC